MKPNYTGVTTAHTPTENRSEWKRRDQARKREIKQAEENKQLTSLIIDCMSGDIKEMRKPHGLRVPIELWEAQLILDKDGIVYATHGRRRERCWLAKNGEIWVGMTPARLVNIKEFDTEIWIFGKDE